MKILAIETSCDETAIALVEAKGGLKNPKFKVLKNIVSSQIAVHRPFGGVVPNIAKREHIKNLPKIFKTLNPKRHTLNPDLIAVTVGPGLEPALWAGIEFAKNLSKELNKPLIGANHMEGHLYSNILQNVGISFPAVALVVSGGHTILLKMDSLTKWKKLGETRDDAAGEAFDKVARLLGLPYPGGPEIQKVAVKGNPKAINFPRPMLKDKNYEFSFSGLKTSVLYYLRDRLFFGRRGTFKKTVSQAERAGVPTAFGTSEAESERNFHAGKIDSVFSRKFPEGTKKEIANVAASFQQAVIDVLVGKTIRAAENFGAESVLLCGGVSANKSLQETLKLETEKLGRKFFVPSFEFNTDNAAMIAAAAYIQHLRKKKLRMEAQSNLNL